MGVRAVSAAEFARLLPPAAGPAPRIEVNAGRGFTGSALGAFLADERSLLGRLLRRSGAIGEGSSEQPGLADLLSEADYIWAHFPDPPDLSSPEKMIDRSFIARARVAAMYYDERLRRIEAAVR